MDLLVSMRVYWLVSSAPASRTDPSNIAVYSKMAKQVRDIVLSSGYIPTLKLGSGKSYRSV
jgi:hypothetical protein